MASIILLIASFCTLIPVLLSLVLCILDLHSLGCNDHNRGFDGTTCRSLTPTFYFLQVTTKTIDASVSDEE